MATDIPAVPRLPLTINDQDINRGALRILGRIRPQWHNIQIKLLTDGITNKLVACKPQDGDVAQTVLVRVYGNKTDLLIDREAETRNIQLLSSCGLAPSLYAAFDNGLAYQYIPGCTLNADTVTHPHIYRLVAKKMAQLHKVQLPADINPKPFLWDKIRKFLALVPDVFTDNQKHLRYQTIVPPKSKIEEEIWRLRPILENLDSPVVFAHNDLLLGNVIYTADQNCVTFIDYEYAACNYQAFDIGNHFAEFVGLDEIDYSKYPNKNVQCDWIRWYLEEYCGQFTDNDVNKLYVQVNKFVLMSHLFWGVWALIQAEHSYIDFDFLGYAATRFNEYFARRDQFLALDLRL